MVSVGSVGSIHGQAERKALSQGYSVKECN